MKNRYILFLLFLCPLFLQAQISVEESTDGSITLTPKGISSNSTANFYNNMALGRSALRNNNPGTTHNAAVGAFTLFSNTAGNYNTALGTEALYSNVANSGSTAVGYRAMNYADNRATGITTYNTALGNYALQGSSTPSANIGIKNTAIGFQVLMQNTSGQENTGSGYQALKENLTGEFNTASGAYSMLKSANSSANTAAGSQALYNHSNQSNEAIGYRALYNSKYSESNVAVGSRAMMQVDSLTSPFMNVAVGYSALYGYGLAGTGKFKGIRNVALGAYAAYQDTSGSFNVAIGYQALQVKKAGSGNTVIGENFSTGAFFGYDYVSQSTSIGLNRGASVRTTAIGVMAMNRVVPENTLMFNTAVGYDALSYGSSTTVTGTQNTVFGSNALYNLSTGNQNVAIGAEVEAFPSQVSTGNNNILIGFSANVPSASGNNQVRVGSNTTTYAAVQVAWNCSSDHRWKENIQPIGLGMNFIKELRPVTYHRKGNADSEHEMGLIAQEVEEALNKLGIKDLGLLHKDENGYLSLRYNDLIPILVKALQEQQEEIEKLQKESQQLSEHRQQITAENRAQAATLKVLSAKFSSLSDKMTITEQVK
ncbi:tail fiber domain-containing protein [Runella sp.]|uniref:tail fiber domain-containing protein n=1 Tax=Runella sp. TaxID=1960881 RepID=UPI003D0F6396